jgi:hypothetical protein
MLGPGIRGRYLDSWQRKRSSVTVGDTNVKKQFSTDSQSFVWGGNELPVYSMVREVVRRESFHAQWVNMFLKLTGQERASRHTRCMPMRIKASRVGVLQQTIPDFTRGDGEKITHLLC